MKKQTKIEELERRIKALEERPVYIPYVPYQPVTPPQYQQYPCPICGRTYPHTCVTC